MALWDDLQLSVDGQPTLWKALGDARNWIALAVNDGAAVGVQARVIDTSEVRLSLVDDFEPYLVEIIAAGAEPSRPCWARLHRDGPATGSVRTRAGDAEVAYELRGAGPPVAAVDRHASRSNPCARPAARRVLRVPGALRAVLFSTTRAAPAVQTRSRPTMC